MHQESCQSHHVPHQCQSISKAFDRVLIPIKFQWDKSLKDFNAHSPEKSCCLYATTPEYLLLHVWFHCHLRKTNWNFMICISWWYRKMSLDLSWKFSIVLCFKRYWDITTLLKSLGESRKWSADELVTLSKKTIYAQEGYNN